LLDGQQTANPQIPVELRQVRTLDYKPKSHKHQNSERPKRKQCSDHRCYPDDYLGTLVSHGARFGN